MPSVLALGCNDALKAISTLTTVLETWRSGVSELEENIERGVFILELGYGMGAEHPE